MLFFVCFQAVLQGIALHAVGAGEDGRTETFLAKTPKLGGPAGDLFRVFQSSHPLGHRVGPFVSNRSPKDVIPLQAADLVAYATTKDLKTVLDPDVHWSRAVCEAFRHKHLLYTDFIPLSRLQEGLGN
jgi:hypothetical protein